MDKCKCGAEKGKSRCSCSTQKLMMKKTSKPTQKLMMKKTSKPAEGRLEMVKNDKPRSRSVDDYIYERESKKDIK